MDLQTRERRWRIATFVLGALLVVTIALFQLANVDTSNQEEAGDSQGTTGAPATNPPPTKGSLRT